MGKVVAVKLAPVNNKLDDIPTREESERMMGKLFSFLANITYKLSRIESSMLNFEHKVKCKFKNND